MSLVAFALRTCTVLALNGATLAGENVFDSPVDPSDVAREAASPSIFVYSDSEHLEDLAGRQLLEGKRTVELSILVVLPAEFSATIESTTTGSTTIDLQGRQAGAATAIDIVYRQIERALIAEESVWSVLWCRLVPTIKSLTSHAYVLPVGTGVQAHRLPARGFSMVVETLMSPPIGDVPRDFWADFVAALATDPGYAPLAPIVSAAIEGTALPEWRVEAIEVGDTIEDAIAMGYGPLGGEATDEPVPMSQATLLDETPGSPDPSLTIADGVPASFEP